MDPVADLRADYEQLGRLLAECEPGAGAAALARERRMIRDLLVALESPVEVPFVDQLADRRQSRTKSGGAAARRRKSG